MAVEARSFEDLLQAVREEAKDVISAKHIEFWLSSPSPEFGGRRPVDILRGDGEKGYLLLHHAFERAKLGVYR